MDDNGKKWRDDNKDLDYVLEEYGSYYHKLTNRIFIIIRDNRVDSTQFESGLSYTTPKNIELGIPSPIFCHSHIHTQGLLSFLYTRFTVLSL